METAAQKKAAGHTLTHAKTALADKDKAAKEIVDRAKAAAATVREEDRWRAPFGSASQKHPGGERSG